jgi:Fe-S cluster assembly protein SufD
MSTTVAAPKPKAKKAENPYLAAFEDRKKLGKEPAWLQGVRKTGFTHFTELGFPTTKHEEWLFTNVDPIAKLPFKPSLEPVSKKISESELHPFILRDTKCDRLVFVDGHLDKELSSLSNTSEIKLGGLREALEKNAKLEKYLSKYAKADENAFAALNLAFFSDGGFLWVPKHVVLEEPVHFLFLSTGQEDGRFVQPRNLIILENNSRAKVIESYVSLKDASYVTNVVTEIILEEGADLEHCKLQGESDVAFHVATIHAHQERTSKLLSHSISTGARLARNDLYFRLEGEGIESILNGLYLAADSQLVDHHTVVDHAKPHCGSHEFYNGILDGKGKAVFNGKIFVRKDAQKTDAKQTNRNLLLSDDATVDTKPQLEIFADDVKCTHGATVGQLDEDAIFYLRARGIGPELARQMLVHAFAGDIINRIQIDEVRDRIDQLTAGGLVKHLSNIYK